MYYVNSVFHHVHHKLQKQKLYNFEDNVCFARGMKSGEICGKLQSGVYHHLAWMLAFLLNAFNMCFSYLLKIWPKKTLHIWTNDVLQCQQFSIITAFLMKSSKMWMFYTSLLWQSLKERIHIFKRFKFCFGNYFLRCFATWDINSTITLSWQHKQSATPVYILFYMYIEV